MPEDPKFAVTPEMQRCVAQAKKILSSLATNDSDLLGGGNGANAYNIAKGGLGSLIAFDEYKACMAENMPKTTPRSISKATSNKEESTTQR